MATNNSFDPPIASPPGRTPANITQVDNRAVDQPWGAIPAVMAKIGKSDVSLTRIEGRPDTSRQGGARSRGR